MLEHKIKEKLRDVPDFPKKGIVFKDITPVLQDPELCREIVDAMKEELSGLTIDVVAGIESRGFLFGMALAQALNIPFVPVRKAGKLPYKTVQQSYDLEYGTATIEIHEDAIAAGQKVLIHDDLLATGGTVEATSKLINVLGGEIVGYSFLIKLGFLSGVSRLHAYSSNVFSLVKF